MPSEAEPEGVEYQTAEQGYATAHLNLSNT
jgi:hypothetical protein